jgi:hypothetical protein
MTPIADCEKAVSLGGDYGDHSQPRAAIPGKPVSPRSGISNDSEKLLREMIDNFSAQGKDGCRISFCAGTITALQMVRRGAGAILCEPVLNTVL